MTENLDDLPTDAADRRARPTDACPSTRPDQVEVRRNVVLSGGVGASPPC